VAVNCHATRWSRGGVTPPLQDSSVVSLPRNDDSAGFLRGLVEWSGNRPIIPILTLCIFMALSVSYFEAAGAEGPSTEKLPPEKSPSEEVKLEDLKPEPLGDMFGIKLLEKIIELEDAFKYLAKEVGQINEKLTKRIDELEEKLTNLEKAPPAPVSATGEPYTPPPPPQKRFEVGELHLGSGFTAYNLAYETTEKGTAFTGEIKNGSSAPVEWVEFEITVFDEDNKLIGAKRFRVTNLHVGESTPLDETVKGPEAHWIKKYEIQFLRRS